jgi:zinc transport system permease protein
VGGFFDAALRQTFMQNALLAGLLAGVSCGIIGTYVVVRRIGYLAGGIAHAVLGGMGIAYFLGKSPTLGALAMALASALAVGWVSLRLREREDTVIGALWATGMALGVLFIAKTPGYNVDLMSYLFGNILIVSRTDLWLMLGLDAVIASVVALGYKQLLAVAFDAEFARLRGVHADFFYLLLLSMVALTVVTLIQVVGLILVIALLTLPAAIAEQYVRSLGAMMVLATVLSMLFTTGGLVLSYQPDLPSGPTVILLAAVCYLISAGGVTLARRLRMRRSSA